MQCGVTEKKEGILFLNDFDFLSVEQKYGQVFLQDLYRKEVSLSLRWWSFDISFAENKKEKNQILNIEWTQIHTDLHSKLIICCSKQCKTKIKWVLKRG